MKSLYPEIKNYNEFDLKVSDLHTIHVEESGNPTGKPVIFLHGGPGGGIEPIYRQYFDPKKWRIIIFDQRGCGQSTPHAELTDNTTWDLVSDIEKIRGVSLNPNALRQLVEREWVEIIGQKDVPGRPSLYATTKYFLDDFGLKALGDLPDIKTSEADIANDIVASNLLEDAND